MLFLGRNIMRKIILMSAVLACSSLQADIESKPLAFYAGAGLVGSSTSSDFSMDYQVNGDHFPDARPYANHKEKHMGRIGGEVFVGVKSKCKKGWFWAAELSYGFTKNNHKHAFSELEDAEMDYAEEDPNPISNIDVKHGNEIGLVGKVGASVDVCNVYGILGVTTKEVEMKYWTNAHTDVRTPFETNPKKRVYGAVFGLGVSKNVHNNVSCALEYKYKLYKNAKKDVDLRVPTSVAFVQNPPHDLSDRHFKVKSDKHEVSLKVAVNI